MRASGCGQRRRGASMGVGARGGARRAESSGGWRAVVRRKLGAGVASAGVRGPRDPLFTAGFVYLTLSDLAYFTAGGALIGVTPFFVTGPLNGGVAAVGIAIGSFSATTLVLRPLA